MLIVKHNLLLWVSEQAAWTFSLAIIVGAWSHIGSPSPTIYTCLIGNSSKIIECNLGNSKYCLLLIISTICKRIKLSSHCTETFQLNQSISCLTVTAVCSFTMSHSYFWKANNSSISLVWERQMWINYLFSDMDIGGKHMFNILTGVDNTGVEGEE